MAASLYVDPRGATWKFIPLVASDGLPYVVGVSTRYKDAALHADDIASLQKSVDAFSIANRIVNVPLDVEHRAYEEVSPALGKEWYVYRRFDLRPNWYTYYFDDGAAPSGYYVTTIPEAANGLAVVLGPAPSITDGLRIINAWEKRSGASFSDSTKGSFVPSDRLFTSSEVNPYPAGYSDGQRDGEADATEGKINPRPTATFSDSASQALYEEAYAKGYASKNASGKSFSSSFPFLLLAGSFFGFLMLSGRKSS